MLIIDLDDTIFQTKSMNPKIFDSAISVLKNYYQKGRSKVKQEELISDLWAIPIDEVFLKYKTPQQTIAEFYQEIARVNFNDLEITPFEDYKEIHAITLRKILVTTGLRELQLAKIKALRIESDFEAIIIDDPRERPRNYKIKIFKKILEDTKKSPQEFWVIGDNPDSEIKAGKELNMRTIQRKSPSKQSSVFSDFEIDTFEELKKIINEI